MKEVISNELQNVLIIYEITNQSPKTWDNYLKLLMQAYKALHPDKAQGTIFGLEANGEKSRGKKDLDAIEINEIQKKKGKNLQYYQICTRKGFKIRQNCIILQTIMTSLAIRTNALIGPLLRNHLYQVQAKIKISHLEHD